MIEQQAMVLAVADGSALLGVTRQSSCSACGQGTGCGTSVVAQLFGNGGTTRLRVFDPIGLEPGDQVVIGIHGNALVRASLAAYILPLLALIGSASAAEQVGLGDPGTVVVGLAGLGLGLWLTRLITGGTGARARFRPVLLRRLTQTAALRVEFDHPGVGG